MSPTEASDVCTRRVAAEMDGLVSKPVWATTLHAPESLEDAAAQGDRRRQRELASQIASLVAACIPWFTELRAELTTAQSTSRRY